MLAAATPGALGAQLAEIRVAKQDWFVVAGRVDKQDISLEADGAVTVRRQQPSQRVDFAYPPISGGYRRPEYRLLEVKKSANPPDFKKMMCHFAMTQAFSAQADGTGTTQMG